MGRFYTDEEVLAPDFVSEVVAAICARPGRLVDFFSAAIPCQRSRPAEMSAILPWQLLASTLHQVSLYTAAMLFSKNSLGYMKSVLLDGAFYVLCAEN